MGASGFSFGALLGGEIVGGAVAVLFGLEKKENHDRHVVLFLSGNFVYFEITIIIYTLKQLFYYFICARM